jgi:hypothetical protein
MPQEKARERGRIDLARGNESLKQAMSEPSQVEKPGYSFALQVCTRTGSVIGRGSSNVLELAHSIGQRINDSDDLALFPLPEHSTDHAPQMNLCFVEIPPVTGDLDLPDDSPSKKLRQRHADRAARELESSAQILSAERLRRKK